jgi:hypothetical protein
MHLLWVSTPVGVGWVPGSASTACYYLLALSASLAATIYSTAVLPYIWMSLYI